MHYILHILYLFTQSLVPFLMLALLPDDVALELSVLNFNSDLIIDCLPVLKLNLIHLRLDILELEPEIIHLLSKSRYLREVEVVVSGD